MMADSIKPLLIGIDASRSTTDQRTGTEAYSHHLIRAMIDENDRHHFRLYFKEPPKADFLPRASTVEERDIPFPRLWTHLRLAAELWCHRVDVLFVPSHVLPIAFPGRAVVTVHDLGYLHFPRAHRRTSRFYLDASTRWNVHRASTVIADSEATRQDLVDQYGLPSDKIKVVYPGYDDTLRPVKDSSHLTDVKRRYGINGAYLLYVGTLQPRKNLDRLIDAVQVLKENHDLASLNLVLAGKEGWLSAPIVEHACRESVILPGFIPEEDKAALLSGATAFIFPSLYEGFGFPILEAMACGTAVICSNTSSLPEVAGDAALLVDPTDTPGLAMAIHRLLSTPSLQKTLVERGFENIKRFSWHQCAKQILSIIEDL